MKAQGSMGQFISKMNRSPTKWINEATWKECLQLSATIPAFSGLCSNVAVNAKFWDKFAKTSNAYKMLEMAREDEKEGKWKLILRKQGTVTNLVFSQLFLNCFHSSVPAQRVPQLGWHWSTLSKFQRLMLVKVLRPECLVEAVRSFVDEQIGAKFVTSVGFDLQEIYEESNERTPLIFILSPGKLLSL